MACLADVNFLVALLHAAHVHSARARAWLAADAPGPVAVCRVAQMGAFRLLTNRAVLREDVLTTAKVWSGWDGLARDERFVFVEEPERFEATWRRLTSGWARGRMAETDAYLAAFAIAGRYALVSFDRGLRRFPELRLEIP